MRYLLMLSLLIISPFSIFSVEKIDFSKVKDSKNLGDWHISKQGIKFRPGRDWIYKKVNDMYIGYDGSSINIQKEFSKLDIDPYISLSLKNMKQSFPDYKLLSQKNFIINGVEAYELTGSFTYSKIKMKIKSIILVPKKDLKIVVTIGGIEKNFKNKLPIYNDIRASLTVVDKEDIKKELNSQNSGRYYIDKEGKYKFWIPSNWKKTKDKVMFVSSDGNSVNILYEEYSGDLKSYVDISLKNMKKTIKNYVEVSKEDKIINGIPSTIIHGKFTMYNNDIELYSIIFNLNEYKYVMSIGGLKSNFKNSMKIFEKIINSFIIIKD